VRIRTQAQAPKKPIFIAGYGGFNSFITDPVSITFGTQYFAEVTSTDIPSSLDAMRFLQWVEAKCNDYSFSTLPENSVRNIGFATSKVAQVLFVSNSLEDGATFKLLGHTFTWKTVADPLIKNQVQIGASKQASMFNLRNALNNYPSFIESITAYSDTDETANAANKGLYIVFTGYPPDFISSVGGPAYKTSGGGVVPSSNMVVSSNISAVLTLSDWSDNGTYNTNIINTSIGRVMAFVFNDDVAGNVQPFLFSAGATGTGNYFMTPPVSGNDAEDGVVYNGDDLAMTQSIPLTDTYQNNEVVIMRNNV
jgi:hypothetical protein